MLEEFVGVKVTHFNSIADPVADILGAAYKSHPERLKEIINYAKSRRCEIIYKDREVLGYSPGLTKGQPGQISIHAQASISAWEHEFVHFLDDEANGFLGMRSLYDLNYRVTTEINAYKTEIEFVKKQKLKNADTIYRLKENFKKELELIQKNLNELITDKNVLLKIEELLRL